MTTIQELVEQEPAADRGVPAGFVYGAGVWRHVLELADPGVGAGVEWYDLTPIPGLFTGYEYSRGGDGYQGRYRAGVVSLDLYAADDSLAPWNPDNSALFGTHVQLGPGLLIRSGFIRVDGGVVVEWNPRFTCKVETWGDAAAAKGRVRRHRVTARDTLSSLVSVPLPGRPAENWFDRLTWTMANAGWPYGWYAYGAATTSLGAPILELPARPASSSALNELDATLDPVGLQWYTDRQGRLAVRPRVNDTFHAAAFAAGAIGAEWPGGPTANFAWWACGEQPGEYEGTDHAAYAVDTPGVEQFGFDATDRWIANHVKITDPTGPGFDDDDPVSISRYDRKSLQAQWMAPNDVVAADLLALRSFATIEARPLNTNIRLNHFHPGPARVDFLDYVSIVHRNTDEGLEAFGNGWLRSYTERVRPLGCDTDWSLALTIDIWETSARATFLLPVEDLAVYDVTDDSAQFSWTNPTQTITPTHTQIRLVNASSLWQTVDYPLDGVGWWGLEPETIYEFQVRLIRVVDGITTHYSPIRSVTFTTLEEVEVDDGCVLEWVIESSPDGIDPWTYVDGGTIVERPYDVPDYDPELLDPDLWYRYIKTEVCDDVPGDENVGDPFVVECVGAARLGTAPYDDPDLVSYWPEVCPNGVIRELISQEPMAKGHALARVDVVNGIPVMVSGGRGLIGSQVVAAPVGSQDLTIGCRIMIGASVTSEIAVFRYGGAWISLVPDVAAPDPDAVGFTINGNVDRGGGVTNTIEGTTIFGVGAELNLLLTHDPGTGEFALYVDGTIDAGDVLSFGNRSTFGLMTMSLPAASWITDAAAWDKILAVGPPPPTGMVHWWDPSAVDTVNSSGFVTLLVDHGSGAKDLVNAGSSTGPKIGVETLNGYPVLTFDNNYHLVDAGAASAWKWMHDGTTSWLAMGLVKWDTTGGLYYWFGNDAGTTNNSGIAARFYAFSTPGHIEHAIMNGSGGEAVLNSGAAGVPALNTWHIISLYFDPTQPAAVDRSAIRINNGTAIKGNSILTSFSPADPSWPFTLGRSRVDGNFPMRGAIGELMISDDPTADYAPMYAYLSGKYGVG